MGESTRRKRRSMASRPLVRSINYGIFVLVRALLVRSPPRVVCFLGDVLAWLGWTIDGRHRTIALENLEKALPELDEKARRKAAFGSFRSFARALFDVIASSRLTPEQLRARLLPEGWHHLEDAEADGKGVILMAAHFGNWETAGQLFCLEGRPVSFMARPIDHPRLEREIRHLRERFGNEAVPKRRGIRRLLSVLQRKGRIFLMIDQRVHPNEGKAYRFFGRPAYTSPLMASLSLRTGAPVVPFYGVPEEDGSGVRVILRPPIRPSDPPRPDAEHLDPVDRLTLRYMEELETAIRKRPDLWFWLHRRWRKNPTQLPKKRARNGACEDADACIERAKTA